MHTILIVDDEPDIREILAFNLEQAGYRVSPFPALQAPFPQNAAELLRARDFADERIDLILLDVMMPGISGFEVARMIRNEEVPNIAHDIPIIFLTALGEEEDVLHGFSLGADDYISKPFSIKEVLARVRAVLKRKTLSPGFAVPLPQNAAEPLRAGDYAGENDILRYESLQLDSKIFVGKIDGEDIGLTKMEYELLHFLMQHPGAVYSRSELLTQVWPDNGLVLDRTVDVTITRLRKKIGMYKDKLKTKTGYGYYWEK